MRQLEKVLRMDAGEGRCFIDCSLFDIKVFLHHFLLYKCEILCHLVLFHECLRLRSLFSRLNFNRQALLAHLSILSCIFGILHELCNTGKLFFSEIIS